MLFSCLSAIATLLLPAGVTFDDGERGCYHAWMNQANAKNSAPVVQLLRYALNLNLAATTAPDGQLRVHEGASTVVFSRTEDFSLRDIHEDVTNALEHPRLVAYCADWRDASKYPSPHEPSGLRWAWEFLRRNEQYALLVTWINSLPEAMRLRDEPNPDDMLEYVLCDPPPCEGLRTVADYRRHCRQHGISAIVVTPLRVLRYCWNVNIPLLPNLELSSEQQEHFFTHSSSDILVHSFLTNSHQSPEFPFQKVKGIISSNQALLNVASRTIV